MANRDVELRIRARDDSQKTLKQVSKTLDDLTSAQTRNADAAKRGDASVRELEQQYKKLENAGQQLLRLNSLTEMFTRQKEALNKVNTQLAEAKKKHSDLSSAMNGASNVTKKMQSDLDKAERAVKRLTDQQDRSTKSVQKTAKELSRFGISSNDIATAQKRIRDEVTRTNQALARQEKIIGDVPTRAQKAHAQLLASLKLQANQLVASTKGYQTLGRVISSLPSMSGQMADLMAPAEAARRKIGTLEKQINDLATASKRWRKDASGMNSDLKALEASAKSAIGMSRMIETFQRQTEAVRKARAEYRSAQADAKNLANQVRQAGTANAEMGAKLQASNARLREASQALRNETASARQTQSALRSAGIDTRNLGAEQQRLRGLVQNSVGGINNLRASLERLSGSARSSGKAFSFFRDEGRTTLSFMQRMRGDVLSLASAYIGVQGAVDMAKGAVEAFKVQQQAMVKIGTVVGSGPEERAKEWEYMLGLSDALGIKIETLSKAYTKFAVSAKEVGLSQKEAKFIFENIAKTARVYHLSDDDMNGVFLALEQMLSKGQVYAEELRQQLGERLPGAVAMFAKSLGKTIPEFTKMMENGEVDARSVINFANEQGKAIEAQLAEAQKGVDAIEARASNAMFNLKLAISKSGFIEAYTAMLEKLTEFITSDRGKEAAEKLGTAFTAIADGVIWAVDNVDLLIDALMVLASIKAIKFLVSTGRNLISIFKEVKGVISTVLPLGKRLVGGIGSLIASTGLLTGALKLLLRAIPFVGVALLAWDMVSILYENNEAFRKFCDETIERAKYLGKMLIDYAKVPGTAIYDLLVSFVRPITTLFGDSIKQVGKWLADLLGMLPVVGDSLSAWVMGITDDLTKADREIFESSNKLSKDIVDNWDKMTGDVSYVHEKAMEKVADNAGKTAGAVIGSMELVSKAAEQLAQKQSGFEFQKDPGTGIGQRDLDMRALKKEIEKRQNAEEKADLAARKAAQRKSLAGRLQIIDEEYAKMYEKAKAIGGKEGDEMKKQIDDLVAHAKRSETMLFNAQQSSSGGLDKRKRKIDAITQALERMNAEVTRRQTKADPESSLDDRINAEIEKSNVKINALKKEALSIGGQEGKQLADNLEKLREKTNLYLSEKMQVEEVKRLQEKLNSLLEIRKNKIDEINAKRKAGLIDTEQQVSAVIAVKEGSAAGIDNAISALENQLNASSSLFSEEELVRITTGIGKIRSELKSTSDEVFKLNTQIVDGVLGGFDTAINSAYDGIVKVATGAESIGDAFANLGVAVAQFFADFLKQIAMAIMQQMILNALAGVGGGVGKAAVSMGGVAGGSAVMHSGGMVGSANRSRGGSSSPVTAIPRFHNGGMPGIKPNEIPTILERGEEVLSKNDPRNIANGGQAARPGGQAGPTNIKLVAVDDRSKIPEAMATAEGEQVMIVNLNRKSPAIRSILNRGSSKRT